MSRDPNFHIPEIEKLEALNKKYDSLIRDILTLDDKHYEVKVSCLLNYMEDYAQEKIDQIFNEENHRNEGKIKVRGEDGVGLVDKGIK